VAFIDYRRELSGTIPELSDILAGTLVNRAYAELRDSRKWSWLVAEDSYFVPGVLQGGLVQVTQFSNQVIADDTADALLTAAVLANPPLNTRQFRVSNGGAIYNIVGYDPPSKILTLERPYLEQSSAGSTWFVLKMYYSAPSTDFLKFDSILNPTMGYSITKWRTSLTKAEFDSADPQRGCQGDPWYVGFYRQDPVTQLSVYEFWPGPTNSYELPFIYRRRGVDLVEDDDTLPPQIETYSFLELCHYHACMWAAKSAGRFASLKGVNWLALANGHMGVYTKWLQRAKIADDEIQLFGWYIPDGRGSTIGPYDAKFAQSHDMTDF
jgi:hypothetical protein